MYGPPASVKTFYAAIPGSEVYDSANGYYSYPCNSLPTVAFSWGGNSWTVTSAKWVLCDVLEGYLSTRWHYFVWSRSFNLGQTSTGSSQCVGALAGQDLGLGSNVWLLGDRYFSNLFITIIICTNQIDVASSRTSTLPSTLALTLSVLLRLFRRSKEFECWMVNKNTWTSKKVARFWRFSVYHISVFTSIPVRFWFCSIYTTIFWFEPWARGGILRVPKT